MLLRGDDEDDAHWARRCRGGKEPRSRALMRLLGAIELVDGWYFGFLRIVGVLNDVADGISRWNSVELLKKSSGRSRTWRGA